MPPRAPFPGASEAALAFANILFNIPPRLAICASTAERIRSSSCGTLRQ